MPIIDMGNLQDAVSSMAACWGQRELSETSEVARTWALIAIAEQLAEANGYLAAISRALEKRDDG